MNVPLFDLSRIIKQCEDDLLNSFKKNLKTCNFINGKPVELFEQEFSRKTGEKYCKGVSSGTDALLSILIALQLPPGSDIIVPSFTFGATAMSVVRAGHNPVFADLSKGSFLVGSEEIEAAWTQNTRAVIFVNLFGEYYDASDLKKICDHRGAYLIGDCAQSFGTKYSSDYFASAFSFFPAKNLGCLGDGGAVVTSSEEFIKKVRVVCQHGCKIKYDYSILGGNFRLDTIQASFLRVMLESVDSWIEKRKLNAKYYLENLQEIRDIRLPSNTIHHSWNQFTLLSERRDSLKKYLENNGIGVAIYYPKPIHKCAFFDNKALIGLPETEKRSLQCLSIPIYPGLSKKEREYIVEKIRSFS